MYTWVKIKLVPNLQRWQWYGVRAGLLAGKLTVSGAVGGTRYAAGNVRRTMQVRAMTSTLCRSWAVRMGPERAISAKGWLAGAKVLSASDIRVATRVTALMRPAARGGEWDLGYIIGCRSALSSIRPRSREHRGPVCQALNGAVKGIGKSSNGLNLGVNHSF